MMNNKGKISIILVVAFCLIGFLLISAGIKTIITRLAYKEVVGTYIRSEEYTTKDDDGNKHTRYRWYYTYYVDNSSYEVSWSGHSDRFPDKTEEKILYNPSKPSVSVMKSDNLGISAIFAGIIFALPPLLIYFSENRNSNSMVNPQIKKERTTFWIFFVIFLVVLGLIFLNEDFSWGRMWIPILFSLGFVGYSGWGLYKSYTTNEPLSSNNVTIRTFGKNGKTYYSFEEYQMDMMKENNNYHHNEINNTNVDGLDNDIVGPYFADDRDEKDPISNNNGISYGYDDPRALINNVNKYERDDLEKKVKKFANKASAIYMIVSGVVWNFLILNLFYLPRFFEDKVPTTYSSNGVTVTKEQFYSNPIGLIFVAFGFVPIIIGIIMLKKKE